MIDHRLTFKAVLFVLYSCVLLTGCKPDNRTAGTKIDLTETLNDPNTSRLIFNFKLNKDVYESSDYGEPPQMAIWIESEDGRNIQTVFVTYMTAKAAWIGKTECPVSLPYWAGRWNKETKTTGHPTADHPVVDAVTGATPEDELSVKAVVPYGSRWNCFIEVNIASDFSEEYPPYVAGMPDPQMNGQPSAIFKGHISANDGESVRPVLVGRTEQIHPSLEIINETESLTTINHIFMTLEVRCVR